MAKRRVRGTKKLGARGRAAARSAAPARPRALAAAAANPPLIDALTGFLGDGSRGAKVTPFALEFPNLQFTDVTVPINESLSVPSGTVFRCRGTFRLSGVLDVGVGLHAPNFFFPDELSEYASVAGVSDLPPRCGVANSLDEETHGNGAVGGAGGRAIAPTGARFLFRPGYQGGAPGISTHPASTDGSAGGGTLVVRANRIVVDGLLRAGGGGGAPDGSSGGAGGVVVLAAREEIVVAGRVTASGGAGGAATSIRGGGGGGGGGILHLIAPIVTVAPSLAPRLRADGGPGGAAFADANRLGGTGGHGGGACGGSGGGGGSVHEKFARAGSPGATGLVLQTIADPVGLFG